MTPRDLALGLALTLVATTAVAKNTPPQDGIYPDVIQHPVPADLSAFKQPASLVADMKAIQTGTLQQRLAALKAKVLHDQVFVKGGTFLMGDFGRLQSKEHLPWDNNSNSSPLHKVTLTSYSISRYKVTLAEANLYAEANHLPKADANDKSSGEALLREASWPSSPAIFSWSQANSYCTWLGKITGESSTLPTEAQWEYAARDRGRFILYATDNGRYEENFNTPTSNFTKRLSNPWKGMHFSILSPVGLFPASPLGLYGMTNGENEWVRDWYSPKYYAHSNNTENPTGPDTGNEKVLRAGGIPYSSTIHRYHAPPNKGMNTFRCVVNDPRPVK